MLVNLSLPQQPNQVRRVTSHFSTRKIKAGAMVCAQIEKEKRDKGNSALKVRPQPANPAICEKKRSKELRVPERHQ